MNTTIESQLDSTELELYNAIKNASVGDGNAQAVANDAIGIPAYLELIKLAFSLLGPEVGKMIVQLIHDKIFNKSFFGQDILKKVAGLIVTKVGPDIVVMFANGIKGKYGDTVDKAADLLIEQAAAIADQIAKASGVAAEPVA